MFKEQLEEAEAQMLPFGFIDDGLEDNTKVVDMGGEKWFVQEDYDSSYLH